VKEVELYKWWLPPPAWQPKAQPYLSRWLMSEEDARKRGAICPELTTRKVIHVGDKPDINPSFAHVGTSWKRRVDGEPDG
jgi:hypothetical protein